MSDTPPGFLHSAVNNHTANDQVHTVDLIAIDVYMPGSVSRQGSGITRGLTHNRPPGVTLLHGSISSVDTGHSIDVMTLAFR